MQLSSHSPDPRNPNPLPLWSQPQPVHPPPIHYPFLLESDKSAKNPDVGLLRLPLFFLPLWPKTRRKGHVNFFI